MMHLYIDASRYQSYSCLNRLKFSDFYYFSITSFFFKNNGRFGVNNALVQINQINNCEKIKTNIFFSIISIN